MFDFIYKLQYYCTMVNYITNGDVIIFGPKYNEPLDPILNIQVQVVEAQDQDQDQEK